LLSCGAETASTLLKNANVNGKFNKRSEKKTAMKYSALRCLGARCAFSVNVPAWNKQATKTQ
jgi:hypothetical protein